jgi:hypothetical protein
VTVSKRIAQMLLCIPVVVMARAGCCVIGRTTTVPGRAAGTAP